MGPRYRAEQVGSLLRPPQLLAARIAHAEGRLTREELQSVEDSSIEAAVRKQRELGLQILTDGEMRRGSWLTDMAESVAGFVPDRVMLDWKGPGGGPEASSAVVAGAKLHKLRKLTGRELPLMKELANGQFKMTLPAPSNFMVTSYKPGITDRFYASHDEFLEDLVHIVHDEVRWLAAEGVRYIQFDAPYYSHYLDPNRREKMRSAGMDPDAEFQRGILSDNICLNAVARGNLTMGVHVCRGNSRSRWYAEGAYDALAEKLFGSLHADVFLLEYDSERAGGFEPLRFVPAGKTVVLGLVTTKTPKLEDSDELRRRIDAAARYISLDNLALSPQCGFASIAEGNLLSINDQWRKLELVVETARKVWGDT